MPVKVWDNQVEWTDLDELALPPRNPAWDMTPSFPILRSEDPSEWSEFDWSIAKAEAVRHRRNLLSPSLRQEHPIKFLFLLLGRLTAPIGPPFGRKKCLAKEGRRNPQSFCLRAYCQNLQNLAITF